MASSDDFPIVGAQIRAGRALVGWSADDLAEKARVGVATVRRAETGQRATTPANLDAIRRALQAAGVEFLSEGDYAGNGGPGVRLRR